MYAEVLSIGDEVTSGRILDTNVQWLSQHLEEIGYRVLYHAAVGDDLDRLTEAFCRAIARADVVVATGGLGPTADDLTRDALAKAVGCKLVTNEIALQHVREMFARRKRPMPPRNELQAEFPEGARVVHNPHGTAPGIDLAAPRGDGKTCRVICLPGVPAEMKEMWADSVGATLAAHNPSGDRITHTQVKCFGAGESQIESMLPEGFLRQTDPVVGINASQTTIIFRIAARGQSAEECRAKTAPVVATIRTRLGKLVFGANDDELETVVLRLLAQRKQTLAVVDWGTGGLLTERLGSVDDADDVYLGGIVAASEAMLRQALDVNAELFAQYSPTSRELAEALAVACRQRFEADHGLAIGRTPPFNAASPEPIFLALATPDGVRVKELPYTGHPATLRMWVCKQALNLVRLALWD